MTTRRGFITGLISFVAAPAIVRVGSLMPVKSIIEILPPGTYDMEVVAMDIETISRTGLPMITWRLLNQGVPFTHHMVLR